MIVTLIGMVPSHLYSDFLCMYIATDILGQKYSKKATILVTFLCSSSRALMKVYLFLNEGLELVALTSTISYLSYITYIIFMYRSSVGKRVLLMASSSSVMVLMDSLAATLMIKITGSFQFMQLDAGGYTIIYIIVTNIFITVGLLLLKFGLKWMEKIKWESGWYQWMSLFLPISQWLLGMYMGQKYLARSIMMPAMSLFGMCIGLMADIYMIVIFLQSNNRRRAEKKLNQVNNQYELEQRRYERLKENQDEISKIRHDFQNYILTIKNME